MDADDLIGPEIPAARPDPELDDIRGPFASSRRRRLEASTCRTSWPTWRAFAAGFEAPRMQSLWSGKGVRRLNSAELRMKGFDLSIGQMTYA